MTGLAEIAAWVVTGIVLVPLAVFVLEVGASLVPRRRTLPEGNCAPAVVLIPAHDESGHIAQTVRSLAGRLRTGDRLLVVADNCTDDTACIAGEAGAEVLVRTDPTRRGKGYALDFAIARLREGQSPASVLVVLDADCRAGPRAIDQLTRLAAIAQRPVQALNLTDRRRAANAREGLGLLANRLTNLIRPLGLRRLGWPCRLMGTGMAIPWPLVAELPPAGGHLAEDLQWGVELTAAGHGPLFCPAARVRSALPPEGEFLTQRRRWEQGYFAVLPHAVPRLLGAAILQRRVAPAILAWDLTIPPLTLLAFGAIAAPTLSAGAWIAGGSPWPMIVSAAVAVAFMSAGLAAWAVHARRRVPGRVLLAAPLYVLAKLPMYGRMLWNRPIAWQRTARGTTEPKRR